jgi:mannitol-1-/sugar-/sorbitol-6-/2-deoxyglucose-6-phosphatase
VTERTIIFDMDGVIIDSEPLWQVAQQETLAVYGIYITHAQCEQHTMGKRIDDIAQTWCELFSLDISPAIIEKSILRNLHYQIILKGVAMPGLFGLLTFLKQSKYKIGLATSSSRRVIDAVFDKLNLWNYFDVICSAEDEKFGKPNPDVYLSAAKKLGVDATECLVIEDSLNGLISAKAASMRVFIVSEFCYSDKFNSADNVFLNLNEVEKELVLNNDVVV